MPRTIVLFNPGISVPVQAAYGALGGFGPPIDWDELDRAWHAGEPMRLRNDLQPGVSGAFPEVRAALKLLRESGLDAPLLSGSGATCFGVARDEAHGQEVAQRLASQAPGAWVQVATVPALTESPTP